MKISEMLKLHISDQKLQVTFQNKSIEVTSYFFQVKVTKLQVTCNFSNIKLQVTFTYNQTMELKVFR